MQWLFLGLVALVKKIFTIFILSSFKNVAIYLTFVTSILALFLAFLALAYSFLGALFSYAPNGVGFGLSLLPDSTGIYISSYLTILIAKRTFDWYHLFTRDFAKIVAQNS